LGDIWETKQVSTKHHTVLPKATPGINQHSPLVKLTLPQKKKTEYTMNWKLAHSRGSKNSESTLEKVGRQGAELHMNYQ
jgi:hypothetical protein